MSRKSDRGAYEFTRAAADEVRDSELAHSVLYSFNLRIGMQRGVWCLEVRATALVGPSEGRVVATYESTWPNVEGTTFESFLYQATHRLARQVEMWWADEQRRAAPRITDLPYRR